MTTQLTARIIAGSRHHSTGAARVRGRALLAALGLALAAAVLPATAVHASPPSPDVENQFANPGGNPQPPEPPDPPHWGPEDLANPTENPEPPLPPDPPEPPDVPDWGPDDVANPTENPEPEPPEPPVGPDDIANPTESPDPDPSPNPSGESIPTPQRVDAGFGGAAVGSHQAAGLALIAAAAVLALLVVVIARRQRAEAGSAR
jgi:outer membrane biosynthesis protein TonB